MKFLAILILLTACATEPADLYECGTRYDVLVDRSRSERAWDAADITVRFNSGYCYRACADPLTGTVYIAPGWDWDYVVKHEICHLKWAHTYHSELDNKPRGFADPIWTTQFDYRKGGKYQRNE